jgi:hypothetical protein
MHRAAHSIRCCMLGLGSFAALLLFEGERAEGKARRQAAPVGLTVNGLAAPLDLDATPRFGWQVSSTEQTAYEIRVSSTRELARAAHADVWSSGKVLSNQQNDIGYEGPLLGHAQRYFWRVRTWSARGQPSSWSPVGAWGTGPGATWADSAPIWAPPANESWGDYTLTTHLIVSAVALGIRFRAPDNENGYMWQFRGSDNRLVPHRLSNGSYSVLESIALPPGSLALGKQVAVRIEAFGSIFRTFIDGVLVHTLEDAMFAGGGVGVRTGNTESGSLADFELADAAGTVLLATDFPEGDRTFGCGSVRDGSLVVPRATSCLESGRRVDWAFLRKGFKLADKPIAWATAYATGTSHLPAKQYVYKLYLNGTFVGLGPTHSLASEARYDGFDVSDRLLPGQLNTLGALAYTTSGRKFLAELVVTYADGSRAVIGTDPTWKAMSGDYALPDAGSIGTSYYAAPRENVDARYFPHDFATAAFDDRTWASAAERAPIAELAAAPMAKVVEQHHAPVAIVEKGPGHYFVDFGRTHAGGIDLTVLGGVSGDTVEVRLGEVIAAADTVQYQLSTGNTYRDIYTMRDGAQRFQTWGIRVFRYAEIVGAPEPITTENLRALALVYPAHASAASFSASSLDLERVWDLSKNTIEALNVNFYTDSWTRERTNYEADAHLQLSSSRYLSEDLSLGRYSLDYFQNHRTWPTEWPLYVILAVHDAWHQTGDAAQLRSTYPSLRDKLPDEWFEPTTQLIRKVSGSNGCNGVTDCDLVDWPQNQRDDFVFREYNTVVNSLAYRAYRDMSALATALAEDTDARAYSQRADALRDAINAHLYDAVAGRYDDGMDANGTPTGHHALHSSAFALAFGVPDASQVERVADYVASRGMACSVYCAAFLTSGLYAAGRGQAALDLLTGNGVASWLNMIRLGAGATAEAWDPSLKSNLTYSHPWAASPAFLIPTGLFGIQPLEPGFARFRVHPQPGALEFANVNIPTVRGSIGAAFDYTPAGSFELALSIPGNTRADASIPVPAGTLRVYVNGVPHPVQPEHGYATIAGIAAGCHLVGLEPDGAVHADGALFDVCRSPPGGPIVPARNDGD